MNEPFRGRIGGALARTFRQRGAARKRGRIARVVGWSGSLLATLVLVGCQTVEYYAQAIHGQAQILNRERPIESLLADPATPCELRARLQRVLEIRTFAEKELHLPANGHYLNYADLGRRYVVWTLHAAPEFSLEPKTWWYPIVGRLNYRGYFSERRARKYANRLRAEGYDVYLGGVTAYSTLGWFHDPVLNTFIGDDEVDLADLLFHELGHQRLFVSGDTDFNEAFATAVAEEGVRRWLEDRHDPQAGRDYEAEARRTDEFVRLVTSARDRLQALYATATPSPPPAEAAELRQGKQAILAQLRQDYARLRERWGGNADHDAWFAHDLNNARLDSVDTYYRLVPAFRQMLRARGGDLEAFYKEARALGQMTKNARAARLAAWSAEACAAP
jgi:predicted aminopeptidase